MTNRFHSKTIETGVSLTASDAFCLSLSSGKPLAHRHSIQAMFEVLTESQQERVIEALGWAKSPDGSQEPQEGPQEAQEATRADDCIRGALEASHVAQWTELSTRASNFGLKVWVDGSGFSIQAPDGGMWKQCATMFELRAALSDYVAHEREHGREPKPQEPPLVITMTLRAVPKMTPEEASAWKKAHPEEAARIEESIREWKRLYPEMFEER